MIPTRTPVNRLDMADIQGNILTAYGRLGFPKGRFILLNVRAPAAGRAFVERLRPRVTTALRWPSTRKGIPTGEVVVERPKVALNIAFTFRGLLALETPIRSLRGMPDEFIDGMTARAQVLGDDVPEDAIGRWDDVWRREADPDGRVHILVTLNAQMTPDGAAVPELDAVTASIHALCAELGGQVVVLDGHKGPRADAQELSALTITTPGGTPQPVAREHFGYADGISDPVFDGQYPTGQVAAERVIGNGAIGGDGVWRPLATGEFLLGYPDEAQEIGGAGMPLSFSRNGTFMAYRKLHQNVAAFDACIAQAAPAFGQIFGIANPAAAEQTLRAKIAGRWSDGVPLIVAPTFESWEAFNRRFPPPDPADPSSDLRRGRALVDFTYAGDPAGASCPLTAHLRRANTRDMLDPMAGSGSRNGGGSVLNNRRRILRRGLPYGSASPTSGDDEERGIVMLNVCASLFRQYEFVQQQWINYGLDFNAGSDACPLVGAHRPGAKFVIPADPSKGHPPFVLGQLPTFVETRGGAYFFAPSMTAMRMIGMGVVDPT